MEQIRDERSVYFIRNDRTSSIKIGVAADPRKRVSELQTGSDGSLELIHTEPGGAARERELHARFSEDRIQGEWFRASEDLVEYLDRGDPAQDISRPRNLRRYDCPLVGHYFHTIKEEEFEGDIWQLCHQQGQVISEVGEGVYLCQLFSWVVGEEIQRILVKLDQMLDWRFYETSDEMNFHYRQTFDPRRKALREAQSAKGNG